MGFDNLFDYEGDVGGPPEGIVDNFLFDGQEKWDRAADALGRIDE